MGKYFGTDGFRGEANVTLNVEQVLRHQEQMHICCMLQRLRVYLMLSEQRSSIAES